MRKWNGPCGTVHVQVSGRPRNRGVVAETRWLPARAKVSAGSLHPWWSAQRVWRGVVRRVPQHQWRRYVGALHQPARLEWLRRRLHLLHAWAVGPRGLPGSHEGSRHRFRTRRRRFDAHGRDRRVVWWIHDGVDHHKDESLQGRPDRSHDLQLVVMVWDDRRAGTDRVRVLWQAVGKQEAL